MVTRVLCLTDDMKNSTFMNPRRNRLPRFTHMLYCQLNAQNKRQLFNYPVLSTYLALNQWIAYYSNRVVTHCNKHHYISYWIILTILITPPYLCGWLHTHATKYTSFTVAPHRVHDLECTITDMKSKAYHGERLSELNFCGFHPINFFTVKLLQCLKFKVLPF